MQLSPVLTQHSHLCAVLCAWLACAVQVLQHEIRKTHARNQKVEWVDDLVLMETIGKGGFGVVYKGSWKGSLAAIKVGRGDTAVSSSDKYQLPMMVICVQPLGIACMDGAAVGSATQLVGSASCIEK